VHRRIWLGVVLGAGLALALLLGLAARAPVQADGGSGTLWVPLSLDRPHDPVVVPGEALPGLSGVPLDEVFVYVIRNRVFDKNPVSLPRLFPFATRLKLSLSSGQGTGLQV